MSKSQALISKKWLRNTAVLLIGTGVAVLVAIFVFEVAVKTAVTYSLLGLFFLSHLFMHGSHGSHGHDHAQQAVEPEKSEETPW